MAATKSYFFCGIGGSGMLPLASIVRAQGAAVAGSDRALDQGRVAGKFAFLESLGVALFPQDGSGLTSADQILVTSAAVEEQIADVQAARRLGLEHVTRPQLLARLFNQAQTGIAVGGTSGKSTVTGMIGWILHEAGLDPTVMNGAVMKNFMTADVAYASALAGHGEIFVSEVDESDGSIALYRPDIAVLNNITLDHKSLDELRQLFRDFVAGAASAILNVDDAETILLAHSLPGSRIVRFSLEDPTADLHAADIIEEPLTVSFTAVERSTNKRIPVRLGVPGRHNVANALAALGAATAAGVSLEAAARALAGFLGLRRRFELVGTSNGVSVIDDFAHNPDKIAATLATLHRFPGRLLILFQPHGYGPLRTMREELIACFVDRLGTDDVLILPDPAFFGGTTDRSVTSADIVEGVRAGGRRAEYIGARDDCANRIVEIATPGDRIVVMGARDDSLSDVAAELLGRL